ncbi:stage II sporulation protein M [Cyclobacterium plantarum]|uniref:stage II sporulation protein M n=1 Tax=Cyclobacterium plantarum TaxID=2716263 RepID=UPI003F7250C6
MNAKPLTLSATAVYLTGVLVGYNIDPGFGIDLPEASPLMDQPKIKLLWSIAGNNLMVALINIVGGFSLGVVSLLNTFYNGLVLGYAFTVAGDNFPVTVILRHLLPHAIEIAAIVLSGSLGFYLGIHLFRKFILGRRPVFDYRKYIFQAVLTLVILLGAAFLEVFVSFSG